MLRYCFILNPLSLYLLYLFSENVDEASAAPAAQRPSLLFRDDFSVKGPLNASLWSINTQKSYMECYSVHSDFSHLEALTSHFAHVENGLLSVPVEEYKLSGCSPRTPPDNRVPTALRRINSLKSGGFRYGEFEWSVKFPHAEDTSTSTTLLLGPPECTHGEIFPSCRMGAPPFISFTSERIVYPKPVEPNPPLESERNVFFYGPVNHGKRPEFYTSPVSLSKDFHKFHLSWTKNALVWRIDGHEAFRMTDKKYIPHEELQLSIISKTSPAKDHFATEQAHSELERQSPSSSTANPASPYTSDLLVDYVIVHRAT